MQITENFLGFYEIHNTQSETLYTIIKDIFLRFDFDTSKVSGQCYEGAANMSGHFSGLQARILEDESGAMYVHCRPHLINLVVQDAMENITTVRNFLRIAKGF